MPTVNPGTIISLFFVSGIIAAYIVVSRISRPINLLASYAKELPSIDFTSGDVPSYFKSMESLPVKYKDEVGRLAKSFLFMQKELKKKLRPKKFQLLLQRLMKPKLKKLLIWLKKRQS